MFIFKTLAFKISLRLWNTFDFLFFLFLWCHKLSNTWCLSISESLPLADYLRREGLFCLLEMEHSLFLRTHLGLAQRIVPRCLFRHGDFLQGQFCTHFDPLAKLLTSTKCQGGIILTQHHNLNRQLCLLPPQKLGKLGWCSDVIFLVGW